MPKPEDNKPAENKPAETVDHGDPNASESVYQPAKDEENKGEGDFVLKAPQPPPGQPGAPATAVFTEMVPVAVEGEAAERPEDDVKPAEEPKA